MIANVYVLVAHISTMYMCVAGGGGGGGRQGHVLSLCIICIVSITPLARGKN